jgi:hypothetical protein
VIEKRNEFTLREWEFGSYRWLKKISVRQERVFSTYSVESLEVSAKAI